MITRPFRAVSPRACASAAVFAAATMLSLAGPALVTPASAQLVERTFRLAPVRTGIRHIRTSYRTGVCYGGSLAGRRNAFQDFQSRAGRGDVMFGYINRQFRGQSCHEWQSEAFQASFVYNLAALPRGALVKRAALVPTRARGRGFRFVPNGITTVCTVGQNDRPDRRAAGPRNPILEAGLIGRRGWRSGYTLRDNRTGNFSRLLRDTLPYTLRSKRRINVGGRSGIDVTRIVNAWQTGVRPNRGIVLTPSFGPALREMAFNSVNQRRGNVRINHCLSVMGPPVLHITVLVRSGS